MYAYVTPFGHIEVREDPRPPRRRRRPRTRSLR